MKKAAIYARVSTDRQEEQRTIESQLAELREVCRRQGVNLVKEFIDDGFSGTSLIRPGLDRLRDDAANGRFQALYILSPDRLARKYLYQLLVLDELRKRDIEVVFLDKPVTDRPEDQLLLGIQGVLAEYERNLIVERSRRGKLHRARNGEFMGGDAPYGYDYVYKSRDTPAHLKVNQREAAVVRLIFFLYVERLSITAIAGELMRRKIRTRKNLEVWRPGVIYRILKNEAYTGTAYYNKCQGPGNGKLRDRAQWIPVQVPAIIDPATFSLAQQISGSRRRTMTQKRVYVLSGLLRCSGCGSRYSGTWHSGNYGYYRCMNFARMRPLPRTCPARVVRADRIERAVVEAVKAAMMDPEVLRRNLMRMAEKVREKGRGAAREKEKLASRRTVLEQNLKLLLDLYLDGGISRADYGEKKSGIEEEIRSLELLEEELAGEVPHIDEERIMASIEQFQSRAREELSAATPEKIRKALRLLFSEMTYDWQSRKVKLIGDLPVLEGNEISSEFPGATTPVSSDNNALRFELMITVRRIRISVHKGIQEIEKIESGGTDRMKKARFS